MGKGTKKSKVDSAKAKWREVYKKIDKVYCPALEAEVLFTNWGWEHLCESKRRSRDQKLKRLELIPLAAKLLARTTTLQNKRFQNMHLHFEFMAMVEGTKLAVVVREYKKQYYFYSVYRVDAESSYRKMDGPGEIKTV